VKVIAELRPLLLHVEEALAEPKGERSRGNRNTFYTIDSIAINAAMRLGDTLPRRWWDWEKCTRMHIHCRSVIGKSSPNHQRSARWRFGKHI